MKVNTPTFHVQIRNRVGLINTKTAAWAQLQTK